MVRITIISLIYKSPRMADWLHESITAATPMIARGDARFIFVANDPTEECLRHLESRGYEHIVLRNAVRSEADLFREGFAAPEYMSRVYRGYNAGIRHADSPLVALINSDNYLCRDWLENLEKYSARNTVITATLVEPGHPVHGVFPDALAADFGRTLDSFDEKGFEDFVERVKQTGVVAGGAYMPCLVWRDAALAAGLYPEGNLAGSSFQDVRQYGDVAFYERLRRIGVRHYTAMDSVAYHLKEGEKDDGEGTIQTEAPLREVPRARFSRSRGRAQVVVKRRGSMVYVGPDSLGMVKAEGSRFFRRLPRAVAGVLQPVLPGWTYQMLRRAWRTAKRVAE